MTDPAPISMQAIAIVVIAIAILAGLAWALRRGAALRRRNQPISVETAVPLGERRSLVIVAVEGRRLLLGLTPGSISMVTELGAAALASPRLSAGGTFESHLDTVK